jgi:hypothetical protein
LQIGFAAGSAPLQVSAAGSTQTTDFAERVRVNQAELTSELRPHYDFIICGSGSSGSVVARREEENPDVSVLLLEAGGSDDVPSVMEAAQWPLNLGSDRDWAFQAQSKEPWFCDNPARIAPSRRLSVKANLASADF